MIDFKNVLLIILGDENINTSDGHINGLEGLMSKFDGFGIRIEEFDRTTKREVSAEFVFCRNTAHGKKLVTDTKDTEIVNVGNELLKKKTFRFNTFVFKISNDLGEFFGSVNLENVGTLTHTG